MRGETAIEAAPAGQQVAAWETPAPADMQRRAKEVYREDIPIAIVSLILAGSTFLPWYKGAGSLDISVSAWQSGTWGPIIFFLGLGSFLLVALRRAGVALTLPFDEALVHEAFGWVSLAGGVIKSRWRPGEGVLEIDRLGLFVGLAAAFALAFLAGRMAPHAAMVRRPKWYRSKAGSLGLLFIVALAAGAATFGSINETSLLGTPLPDGQYRAIVRGRLPDCAGEFPLPAIVKPLQGVEAPSCLAHLQSDKPPDQVVAAIKTTLSEAGWTVTEGDTTAANTTLNVSEPRCATIGVVGGGPGQGSIAIVAFGVCTTPSPSPSGQPSP
ncbi:MAG: hypothetical protein ACRDKS_10555 [Actinomycetota bacterium]